MRPAQPILGLILAGLVLLAATVLLRQASRTATPDPLVIICAGDSITAASYPRRLAELFRKQPLPVRVVNLGLAGHNSGQYLRFLETDRHWAAQRPDHILLQLGTNDVRIDGDRTGLAQFDVQMSQIIELLRTARNRQGRPPQIWLATVPPIKTAAYPFDQSSARRVEEEINPAVRRLAKKYGLNVADNYSLFTAQPELLPGIHPSPAGYQALAGYWHQLLAPDIETGLKDRDHAAQR